MMLLRDTWRGLGRLWNAFENQRYTQRVSLVQTMRMVAENLPWYYESGADSFEVQALQIRATQEQAARIRLAIETLERFKLKPLPQEKNPKGETRLRYRDAANFLYQTIPVVEERGIRDAQKNIAAMNEYWQNQPIPDGIP